MRRNNSYNQDGGGYQKQKEEYPIVYFTKGEEKLRDEFNDCVLDAYDEWKKDGTENGQEWDLGHDFVVGGRFELTKARFFEPNRESKVLAYARVEINGCLWISSIRIVDTKKGTFVFLPKQ